MIDQPLLDIDGNVLHCADGTAWAVWRVQPPESSRSTGAQLRSLYDRTLAFTKALRGEVLLASLCEQVQPATVAARCLGEAGLDGADPHWLETVDNTWSQIEDLEVLGRTFWLAKPLGGTGWRESGRGLIRAVSVTFSRALGVTTNPVSARERAVAVERARAAQVELGAAMPLRPATEAELLWWLTRAPVRGACEPQLERPDSTLAGPGSAVHGTGITLGHGRRRARLAVLRETLFDVGGRTDTDDVPDCRSRAGGLLATLGRRYLKCVTPADPAPLVSYQALLVLAEMPSRLRFPGSEILPMLADLPFGVDYALRITATGNEAARAANRRRTRDLLDQDDEHGADGAGIPADLLDAQEEQQDKNARLGSTSTEIELDVGVIACVWGATAGEADERACVLRGAFSGTEFTWERPLGGQTDLYRAMLPGYRTPMVVRDYAQNLLSSGFAMLLPFSSTEFGDPSGAMFGMVVDGGGIAPFHLDPTYGPSHDAAGGIAACGELGSGKSVLLKNVAAVVRLALGGRVIAVDRTRSREWIPVAAALPGDSQVVDVIDPSLDTDRADEADLSYSCDPLRVFTGKTSTGIAETFFAAWLDLESASDERDALATALGDVTARPDASSNALIDTLTRHGETNAAARVLAQRLSRLRADPITRVVFDPELAPVDLLGADMVVFCTHEIPMPTKLEMDNERLAARINPRKLFGRAFHLLIAAIAREICFHTDRWGEFICDEAYSVTGTPEGQQIALEFVRDGRKHGADMAFGSHDPLDLGDEVLRGLIAVRFLGRHRDHALARNGLAWIGRDPDDPANLEVVTQGLSPITPVASDAERRARAGEFLARDHSGRVARVKVITQPYRTLPTAVLTTPRIRRPSTGGPAAGAST